MRVLLVEDDELIANGVRQALARKAYQVDWINNGSEALSAAKNNPFDLIILDLGLPVQDGMEVLRMLRQGNNQTHTIILSARDATQDRIAGLNMGADDYLVKPFELEELFARIHALERRMGGAASNVLNWQGVTLNLQTLEVIYQGEVVNLQRREFSLLKKLIENPHRVFTREQLEESLYGWTSEVGSNTIDVYVHNIRKKIAVGLICTVRGVGYRMGQDGI
ncbi:MAG: response regulator transcription factor [Limnobacter sp.]|nr:response regulator transcription factor [Limnobacter sp.]